MFHESPSPLELRRHVRPIVSICQFVAAVFKEELYTKEDIDWMLEEMRELENSVRNLYSLLEKDRTRRNLPRHQF